MAKRYHEDIHREKAVSKTITLRLRVTSTEFAVLADALAGSMAREAKTVHGCQNVRVTGCQVNGREVSRGSVNRGMKAPSKRKAKCGGCGSTSLRLRKNDTHRCRACGFDSVASL